MNVATMSGSSRVSCAANSLRRRYLPKPVDTIRVEDSVDADNWHSILDANCGQQAVERVSMMEREVCGSQCMWRRDGQDLIPLQLPFHKLIDRFSKLQLAETVFDRNFPD